MAERFLIRTEGGPVGGEVRVANADPEEQWTWPLPDVLGWDDTGRYLKVRESQLPPQDDRSNLARGATYEWRPVGSGTVWLVTACCLRCSFVAEAFWSDDGDAVCETCRQPMRIAVQRAATAAEIASLGDDDG